MDGGVKALAAVALAVAGLGLPLAASALPFFDKGPYRKGDPVVVSGQVTDAAGRALGGVTVLLEVSRHAFRLSRLGRETTGTLRLPFTADEAGRYRIDWRWDPYYNGFALLVALPVREAPSGGIGGESTAGRDGYEVFHRREITAEVDGGSPVSVGLVLPDAAGYDALRAFLASLTSEDEKRVYRELGRPDRVDAGQAHYDPDRTWWYFAAGRAYRFRDGRLDQVVRFEPISPVGESGAE
ncbi:MAG TPA: hypothetical protein VGG06_34370 [Thermoanaerobaculia bacterium]|jgi:hypothetical protein